MKSEQRRCLVLRARTLLLFLGCLALLMVPWRETQGDRLMSWMQDTAHFPLFGGLAFLVMRRRPADIPWKRRIADTLGVIILFAVAVEAVQPLAGRSTSLRDLLFGTGGAVAGVALHEALRSPRRACRLWCGGMVVLALGVAAAPATAVLADRWTARKEFPVLASFESILETGRWSVEGCRVARVRECASEGRCALRVTVRGAAAYPGVFLTDAPRDWRGLRDLCLDLFLPGEATNTIWVRLDDRTDAPYAERFQESFTLPPGSNRVCIGRERLATPSGRPLDLSSVHLLGVFFDRAQSGDRLYLDRVVLTTESAP